RARARQGLRRPQPALRRDPVVPPEGGPRGGRYADAGQRRGQGRGCPVGGAARGAESSRLGPAAGRGPWGAGAAGRVRGPAGGGGAAAGAAGPGRGGGVTETTEYTEYTEKRRKGKACLFSVCSVYSVVSLSGGSCEID